MVIVDWGGGGFKLMLDSELWEGGANTSVSLENISTDYILDYDLDFRLKASMGFGPTEEDRKQTGALPLSKSVWWN